MAKAADATTLRELQKELGQLRADVARLESLMRGQARADVTSFWRLMREYGPPIGDAGDEVFRIGAPWDVRETNLVRYVVPSRGGSFHQVTPTSGSWARIAGALCYDAGLWPWSRGLVVHEGSTNYVQNPSFENNVTDYWTLSQGGSGGARAQDMTRAIVGRASCKVTAGTDYVRLSSVSRSISNGGNVSVSAWVYRESVSCDATVALRDVTNGQTRASQAVSAIERWERITLSWENDTGGTANVQLWVTNDSDDSSTELWIDSCQLEEKAVSTHYFDGDQGDGFGWAGTAHNSTSSRTQTLLEIPDGFLPNGNGSICMWLKFPYGAGGSPYSWGRLLAYGTYTPATDDFLIIYWDTDGDQLVGAMGNSSTYRSTGVCDVNYSADEWIFIAMTYGSALRLYFQGERIGQAGATPTLSRSKNRVYIGSNNGGTECTLPTVGMVAFIDRELTQWEISKLYGERRPFLDGGGWSYPFMPGAYKYDIDNSRVYYMTENGPAYVALT